MYGNHLGLACDRGAWGGRALSDKGGEVVSTGRQRGRPYFATVRSQGGTKQMPGATEKRAREIIAKASEN